MNRQIRITRMTNTIKCLLLLYFLYVAVLIIPVDPVPSRFPWPISKKLPGQPSQPPVKPLSTYTINIE